MANENTAKCAHKVIQANKMLSTRFPTYILYLLVTHLFTGSTLRGHLTWYAIFRLRCHRNAGKIRIHPQ